MPPRSDLQAQAIDLATLEQLIEDLAAHAEIHSVQLKQGPTAHATPAALPIREARDRLLRGEARALQVQYRWDGDEWLDTVLAAGGGWRIVRTRVCPSG